MGAQSSGLPKYWNFPVSNLCSLADFQLTSMKLISLKASWGAFTIIVIIVAIFHGEKKKKFPKGNDVCCWGRKKALGIWIRSYDQRDGSEWLRLLSEAQTIARLNQWGSFLLEDLSHFKLKAKKLRALKYDRSRALDSWNWEVLVKICSSSLQPWLLLLQLFQIFLEDWIRFFFFQRLSTYDNFMSNLNLWSIKLRDSNFKTLS